MELIAIIAFFSNCVLGLSICVAVVKITTYLFRYEEEQYFKTRNPNGSKKLEYSTIIFAEHYQHHLDDLLMEFDKKVRTLRCGTTRKWITIDAMQIDATQLDEHDQLFPLFANDTPVLAHNRLDNRDTGTPTSGTYTDTGDHEESKLAQMKRRIRDLTNVSFFLQKCLKNAKEFIETKDDIDSDRNKVITDLGLVASDTVPLISAYEASNIKAEIGKLRSIWIRPISFDEKKKKYSINQPRTLAIIQTSQVIYEIKHYPEHIETMLLCLAKNNTKNLKIVIHGGEFLEPYDEDDLRRWSQLLDQYLQANLTMGMQQKCLHCA